MARLMFDLQKAVVNSMPSCSYLLGEHPVLTGHCDREHPAPIGQHDNGYTTPNGYHY
jgi:hypothetical protein